MNTKREWDTPYNEFNSAKVLYFKEHVKGILEGKFLPPITADIDLDNHCNLDCIWCNSKGYRLESQDKMTTEHAFKLLDFLRDWGVKSICLAGGGESMLHEDYAKIVYKIKENGLKLGVITNGTMMNEENVKAIAECGSWCSVSIDAGTPETYCRVKNIKDKKLFSKVIENVANLVKEKKRISSNVEVTYKYLLHPENARDIYDAVKIAKRIGVNTFHLRPACTDNIYHYKHGKLDFSKYIKVIEKQFAKAYKMQTDTFKFYSVRHKFGSKFERKIPFKKCLATPLQATFGADGNVHLCFDVRGKKEWILCRHDPNPEEVLKAWGSDKHKKIIDSVKPELCPRCTFTGYNQAIEEAFINDGMYLNFT